MDIFYIYIFNIYIEYCLLSNNIYDYRIVSQGKTTIPSVNDGEEWVAVDVRPYRTWLLVYILVLPPNNITP